MTDNNKAEVVLPQNVTLTQDLGPYMQGQQEKERKLERQVKGVMFLDKLEQDRILKDETPKYEKAIKQAEVISKKVVAAAKRAVADLKKDDRAVELKAAMKEFGIAVTVTPEFKSVDLEVEGVNSINYSWLIRETGERYGGMESDSLELEIPEKMAELLKKYWDARKEAKRAKDAIIAAQEKLNDRANRMADAEGALAIRGMGEDEREEMKSVYEDVKNGIDAGKLIGSGK